MLLQNKPLLNKKYFYIYQELQDVVLWKVVSALNRFHPDNIIVWLKRVWKLLFNCKTV